MLKDGTLVIADEQLRTAVQYALERSGNNPESQKKHRRTCLDGTGTEASNYIGQFACRLESEDTPDPSDPDNPEAVTRIWHLHCYNGEDPNSQYAGAVSFTDGSFYYNTPKYTSIVEDGSWALYLVRGGPATLTQYLPRLELRRSYPHIEQPHIENLVRIASVVKENDRCSLIQEWKGVGYMRINSSVTRSEICCGINVTYNDDASPSYEIICASGLKALTDKADSAFNLYCYFRENSTGVVDVKDIKAVSMPIDIDKLEKDKVLKVQVLVNFQHERVGGRFSTVVKDAEIIIGEDIVVQDNLYINADGYPYPVYALVPVAEIRKRSDGIVFVDSVFDNKTWIQNRKSFYGSFFVDVDYTYSKQVTENKVILSYIPTKVVCYGGMLYLGGNSVRTLQVQDCEFPVPTDGSLLCVYLTYDYTNNDWVYGISYLHETIKRDMYTWYYVISSFYVYKHDEKRTSFSSSIYEFDGEVRGRWVV